MSAIPQSRQAISTALYRDTALYGDTALLGRPLQEGALYFELPEALTLHQHRQADGSRKVSCRGSS